MLWKHFKKHLREIIEAQTMFEEVIRIKHIDLLLEMKQHVLYFEEPMYWISVAPGTRRAFLNCGQRDNEALSDYTRFFKEAR